MAVRKRNRVPEVLWRLFGNRARTLAETILALIPPPPDMEAACLCKERRCLSCSGDEAMSFLVSSDDSSDYRKLLSKCFVVVSQYAPPVPVFDPQRRWSQSEIVRRSIEMILHEEPLSRNLICCSYDKDRRSSATVDELTSSKWTVLLKRIGDALMIYLLKYTSIFLPLPRNKHHQISGCFAGDLSSKFSRCMPMSRSQHHPLACRGYENKRKRADADEFPRKQLCSYTLGPETSPSSTNFATTNRSPYVTEELPHKQSERNSKKNTLKSQKRTHDCRWQRQRKRRQLAVRGTPSLIPCRGNSFTTDKLSFFSSSSQSDIDNISHCFCCSVFQTEPRMKRNAEIDRKYIFYQSENSLSMLPRKHILHTLRPNDSGASVLFNDIFVIFGPNKNAGSVPCCHCKTGCPTNSTCLYHLLKKLLKHLICESQKCKHVRLLEKHCFIRSSYEDASREAGIVRKGNDAAKDISMSRQDAVQSEVKLVRVAKARNSAVIPESTPAEVEPIKCCPKNQIVSFIWAICRRIVPPPLLGERSNWRILRRNISKFIQLRRFEKFSLKECIYKLKISKFPIFSNKQTGCSGLGISDIARHAIFESWMFWFFAHLVSPLVQANFYVTECEHEKQELLYYRKSTWEKLINKYECMADDGYYLLKHKTARDILRKRSFGFSRARLLPKHKGFRMLSNLRAPSKMYVDPPSRIHSNRTPHRKSFCNERGKHRFFKSVNSCLHDVHAVLKGLWAKKPEKLGSSVFDYGDVYKKLVPFLFHLKGGSTILPNVFIVVSDVSKAFDSVNHNKLLSVMDDVLSNDEFTLEKFIQVIYTGKSLKINQHLVLAHQDIAAASTRIRSRLRTQSLDSIVVKKELSRIIRKEEISSILKEHITRNIVQLGNKFYLQHVGIPQGSILSSLLCSFYYGHMERSVVFPFLEKSSDLLASPTSASAENHKIGCEYLLLRFIDDFLFISTSKKQASMFFSRLERGVRDYNCSMNKEKYGLNFTMDSRQGCQSNRLHISKDGISFLRWSGLLVNCSTLEIQADYTRYLNYHLTSTLTVCRQGKVGRTLTAKLKAYLKPKCHPIFYDSNINSPGVVRLNIYQAFLLCAMKFISHLSNLSILPRFNPKFCINAIDNSLSYMNRLIQRKMYSFQVDPAFRPKYDVKKKDVIWLGLYAYSRVLKKKQSQYKALLRLIGLKLKVFGEVENMPPELKYAIDDVHSSVLWSIRY